MEQEIEKILKEFENWDIAPLFRERSIWWKENLTSMYQKGKEEGMRGKAPINQQIGWNAALEEVENAIKEKYGPDGQPVLMVLESYEGGSEGRPGIPEMIALLANLRK